MTYIIMLLFVLSLCSANILLLISLTDKGKISSKLRKSAMIATCALAASIVLLAITIFTDYKNAIPDVTIKEQISANVGSEITIDDLMTINNKKASFIEARIKIVSAYWEDGSCNGISLDRSKINIDSGNSGDVLKVMVILSGDSPAAFERVTYTIPVTIK